ncbi:amidohydrolase family protein [Hyphococcus sp.]|jgi:predicted TIM-barrel fold metal-dependent hydrolase|uniref:amidohydrolase family protein n=1 Tax=Hyphococcus sp. TaxID=2038636 RepID=UPI003D0ECDC2
MTMRVAADASETKSAKSAPADVPPVVDCHAHIFQEDMPLSSNAWTRTNYSFTAADYLSLLDQYGIHFGVISGLSISGFYNDYMISELRKHKRLRGTAIVSPATDRYSLERMRDDGIIGIRLQLARMTELPDFRSEEFNLLFRRVRDLDWHVHVAIEGPLLPPVLKALEESGVKVVIDHFGHPDPALGVNCPGYRAILKAAERGNTWVKLSGGFRLLGTAAWRTNPDGDADKIADDLAKHLVANVGVERLLWGSDCPFVGYEGRITFDYALDRFRRWVPDPQDRWRISQTALKLYFG